MLEVGSSYEATLDVYDETGVLKNATTIVLTVTLPDGTTATPTITNPPSSTGKYTYLYAFTVAGLHKFQWVTTQPGTAKTDYVTAREFISLISIAEAKQHLGMTTTAHTDDGELTRMLQAATEAVESKAGYTVRRQFTDRVREGRYEIVLPRRPVLAVTSVTSVWPGGPSWTTDQLDVDHEAGIISQLGYYPFWYSPWDVLYTVGRAVPLEKHIHACKELLRHLWQTQRGPSPMPPLAGEENYSTSFGWSFSIPRRVLEMLDDEMMPSL